MAYGAGMQRDRDSGQSTLFGDPSHQALGRPRLPEVPPWSDIEILAHEKESLGYWISGHPLDSYKEIYDCFVDLVLSDLENAADNRKVIAAGILTKIKIQASRAGKQFGILSLEDFSGTAEVIIFSDILEKRRLLLKEGNAVLVFGAVSDRDGKRSIKGDDLTLLDAATREFPVALRIRIESSLDEDRRRAMLDSIAQSPGECDLIIEQNGNGKRLVYKSTKYRVNPGHKLVRHLKNILGAENVRLQKLRKPQNGLSA
jgi:DNA polymerase-3 subunit alpha